MLKIRCSKCGHVFYNGDGFESETFVNPRDIIARSEEGKCPKCGKILTYNPEKRIKNAKRKRQH